MAAVALLIGLAACAHEVTVAPLYDAVTRLAKADPESPETLQARLEYAGSLVQQGDADCRQHLDEAQAQLNVLAISPALSIVLPLGPARLADIEYRVHEARASCSGDPATHESELRAALAAAQRDVRLYREALDYASMAIMQFNVGVTERQLGRRDAAVAAVQSAIRMDHVYGLREDAEDNEQVLARWTGGTAHVEHADHTGVSSPARSVNLKFGWHASDARVRIEVSSTTLIDGEVAHADATRTVMRHIRAFHGGWRVFYGPGPIEGATGTGVTRATRLQSIAIPFTQALLELPELEVDARGNLINSLAVRPLAAQLVRAAQMMVRDRSPAGHRLSWRELITLRESFSPPAIATLAEELYSLETGAWIDTTFEQGVWYPTTAMLLMPGMNRFILAHDVEMAYTRDVPCTTAVTERRCVEILVHAAPQAAAIEQQPRLLSPGLDYWSCTYVRLVVDPQTLLPYVRDTRQYWYISPDPGTRGSGSGSERVVATFNYSTD